MSLIHGETVDDKAPEIVDFNDFPGYIEISSKICSNSTKRIAL
jgi:hypothetical protein